jgi:cytosine/adenosine deaminase-related metal-dependent hydrolase
MRTLLVKNVRPPRGEAIDLLVVDGRIQSTGPGLSAGSDATVIDGENRLVMPGLVDAHAHLDKNLLGLPWFPHKAGRGLQEMIAQERTARLELGIDFRKQAAAQIRREIAAGTTHIRTGVDVDTEGRLRAFEGVQRAKEDFAAAITIQIVAFPQSGMLVRPGTVELMEEALRNGADVVGGIDPSLIDRDPVEHVNTVFRLAERHDRDIDFHLHELGELGAFSIELIAERTRTLGWQGRVVIGHAFCLGDLTDPYLGRVFDLLAENRIAIDSNGVGGMTPYPPVKRLREQGVVVCTGIDGVRDTWAPMNVPDMLLRAYILAFRNGLTADEELELVLDVATNGGATVLRAADYGLSPGARADFLVMNGQNHIEALIERPPRWLVVNHGRVVAREGECLV